eukprot:scaffold1097_cov246-Pinguiococcus_pyrenoidosus.AAC.13
MDGSPESSTQVLPTVPYFWYSHPRANDKKPHTPETTATKLIRTTLVLDWLLPIPSALYRRSKRSRFFFAAYSAVGCSSVSGPPDFVSVVQFQGPRRCPPLPLSAALPRNFFDASSKFVQDLSQPWYRWREKSAVEGIEGEKGGKDNLVREGSFQRTDELQQRVVAEKKKLRKAVKLGEREQKRCSCGSGKHQKENQWS